MSGDGVGARRTRGEPFLFALTLGLKDNPLVPIGPGFYPRIVLGVTAVLRFGSSVGIDRSPARPGGRSEAQKLNYLLVVEIFAIFGVYLRRAAVSRLPHFHVLSCGATNALLEGPPGEGRRACSRSR